MYQKQEPLIFHEKRFSQYNTTSVDPLKFLHVDISHLFLNMFTLYFFAPVVISWFGSIKFLIIYLVSLIAGSLLALVFHKDEPYYSAVGASGAVMGVLYAAILLNPDMQLGIMFIPIPVPAYVVGIGYLLYSIYLLVL